MPKTPPKVRQAKKKNSVKQGAEKKWILAESRGRTSKKKKVTVGKRTRVVINGQLIFVN